MTSAGVVWCLLSFTSSGSEKETDIKRDSDEAETPIKEESDDETIGPGSSSQQVKEELASESSSPSPHESDTEGENDDEASSESASARPSGSGSGFENPGAARVQRRRSHFKEDIS